MGADDIATRLRALATDDKRRPQTARLRDIFADVEATLKAGVPQADVLAELHRSGFTMTMAGFKSALQRIRKERTPPTKQLAKIGNEQAIEQPCQSAPTPQQKNQVRITNPAHVRKSMRRDIDLESLQDGSDNSEKE